MSTPVFHRRRVERFAQLLDEADGARRHHTRSPLDDDLTELVAIGHRMSALEPNVEVDSEFRTGLRAMLIATAEREGIGARTAAAPPAAEAARRSGEARPARRGSRPARDGRRARVRGAIIAGVAVGAVAVSGISTASEDSVPGDALYGMKRSTERAQLALAGSDLSRGQLFLDFARTRLGEADAVRHDRDSFAALLHDMDEETREGVKLLTNAAVHGKDEQPLDAITAFLADQQSRIGELLDHTGAADRERVAKSAALLDMVAKRVDELRRWLACGAGSISERDGLGPHPPRCAAGSGSSGSPAGSRQQDQRPDRGVPARTGQTGAGTVPGKTATTPATGSAAPGSPRNPSAPPSPRPTDEDDQGGPPKHMIV